MSKKRVTSLDWISDRDDNFYSTEEFLDSLSRVVTVEVGGGDFTDYLSIEFVFEVVPVPSDSFVESLIEEHGFFDFVRQCNVGVSAEHLIKPCARRTLCLRAAGQRVSRRLAASRL